MISEPSGAEVPTPPRPYLRLEEQATADCGEWLDHPDVRALLNTPGKGRSDGRRGRRGRGGNDEGTGVGY